MNPLPSIRRFALRLHADQRGVMSIVTVFSVILLAILLGMLVNIGRHVNRKVKMQNAADAAAFSGGAAVARGMNTLAFTNHLLCDVFAMTAYLREARDRHSEPLANAALDQWLKVAPNFAKSAFPPFRDLGEAIPLKVPLEREMIRTFGEVGAATSAQLLPVFEEILDQEMISVFQRTLVPTVPRLAAQITDEIARRHGDTSYRLSGTEPMHGILWRTIQTPVGGTGENWLGTLPAVDPMYDQSMNQQTYKTVALQQRRNYARNYLGQTNATMLVNFDRVGKMSQYANFYRGFSCAQLNKLLDQEYPSRNLPFVLRRDELESIDSQAHLERDFMFVGVAYWEPMPERYPGLFKNPLDGGDTAFAQVMLTIPQARLFWRPDPWAMFHESIPTQWDLMNQNWSVQLVPATAKCIPDILQTEQSATKVKPHNLGGMTLEDFRRINTH